MLGFIVGDRHLVCPSLDFYINPVGGTPAGHKNKYAKNIFSNLCNNV